MQDWIREKIESNPIFKKVEDDRENFYDAKSVSTLKVISVSMLIFLICSIIVFLILKLMGFV